MLVSILLSGQYVYFDKKYVLCIKDDILMNTLSENRIQLKELNKSDLLHEKKLYWFGRRSQDIFFSGLALIILFPVMALTALIVFIDDPHGSPIFFRLDAAEITSRLKCLNSVPCIATRKKNCRN